MLLLNKFIKITGYIKYNCNITTDALGVIIYKNNEIYHNIYYDDRLDRNTRKNNIIFNCRKTNNKISAYIHVQKKTRCHLLIFINSLTDTPFISVQYINAPSNDGPKEESFSINFSEKNDEYKLAIDKYLYLREYVFVKRLSE